MDTQLQELPSPLTASALPPGSLIDHLAGARRMALATLGFSPWGGDWSRSPPGKGQIQ